MVEARVSADLHLQGLPQQRRLVRDAVTGMKRWATTDVARFESELDQAMLDAGIHITGNGEDCFMDWSDVAGLAPPSPLVAASHGCSHVPLTTLAAPQVKQELLAGRERVGAAVGRPVTAIAYPNGNYDETVVELARQVGYRIGFTTERGLVSEGDDLLKLRRLNVHEASTRSLPEFLCIILGVFHKWPKQV
jgi:hypothetical protein